MSQFKNPRHLTFQHLEEELETLQKQNFALSRQVFDLSTSQREKELALEEIHRLQVELDSRDDELNRIRHTCKLAIPDSWKIMVIVLPYTMAHACKSEAPRDDGMVHIYVYDLARDIGKERQQTGQILIKMAEAGLISRDAQVYVTANGERSTNVYVSMPPIIRVDTYKPKSARGDANRFTCPNCKHQLHKAISYHCDNCNLDFDEHGCFVEPDQKEVS